MKNVKNVIKGLLLSCVLLIVGMFTGVQGAEAKEIVNVITESTDNYYIENGDKIIEYNDGSCDVIYNADIVESFDKDNNYNTSEFYIIDTYMKNDIVQITLYNDNSFAVIDRKNNIYEFTSSKLGDWNYTCNSVDELNKLILDYKYHFNENKVNNFYETNRYYNGTKLIIEYNDNSYVVLDTVNNYYEFVPAITTDYGITFNNIKDLNNCIATYKSIKEYGYY